ncbi:MAG: ribonuclease P protein component [Ruminococcaceae bacterium]|nr:ribonuclease P protein component [Oscillospiraceae bacterium]
MKNTVSIKENREFSYLYRRGKFISSDCLIIYFRANRFNKNRLGITVSKKVGKAVIRNRVRRRIKESYREVESMLPLSYDFVIVARSSASLADYKKILSALKYLFKKAGLLSYEKNTDRDN